MSGVPISRREALAAFGAWLAGSPLLRSQGRPVSAGEPLGRLAPVDELVNTLEFAQMAERSLSAASFAKIRETDRDIFDRITFRQRLMVSALDLDLTADVLGESMFTPIIVGPASRQNNYHPDGESAMARGASAAKAAVVISDRGDAAIEEVAAAVETAFWFQVYPSPDDAALTGRLKAAVRAGSKAVCLTLGAPHAPTDWAGVDRIRDAVDAPLVVKGLMSAEQAATAVEHGAQAVVVSNHGGRFVPGLAHPMSVLPAVAAAVGDQVSVLIDGGFRRGSDVLKALCLGADAVLVARPPLWGLAAYGADGVQTAVELMQTELAADMAMLGAANVMAASPELVRFDRW